MGSAKISIILCLCGFFTAARVMARITFGNYTLIDCPVRNVEDAKRLCEANGQSLVNFETEYKFEEVTTAIMELDTDMFHVRHDFWTGGYLVPESGKYFWSNGIPIPMDASYWGPGRPKMYQTDRCITSAFFPTTGTWGLNTWKCSDKQNFMCEGVPIHRTALKRANDEINDEDDDDEDRPVAEKYTIVSHANFNFDDAKRECNMIGKDLVSFRSPKKWREIKGALSDLGFLDGNEAEENLFWTDGKFHSGQFVWTNGNKKVPINSNYWGPRVPKNKPDHKCISIAAFSDAIMGLNDHNCAIKLGYICEFRKPTNDIPSPSPKFNTVGDAEWQDIEIISISKQGKKKPRTHTSYHKS